MAEKRKVWRVKDANGSLEQVLVETSAEQVTVADTAGKLTATNVEDALQELATNISNAGKVNDVKDANGNSIVTDKVATLSKAAVGLVNVTNDAQVKRSEMGAASGVATLDTAGKVPSSQLPSYVDDVLEYVNKAGFPATGESGKIYVAQDTNLTYRWSGSAYIALSSSVVLGETSATAYRGDRGKIAYDHSQTTHAPSNAQANVIESIKVNGTALTPSSKAVNITVPTKTSDLTNDSGFKTTDNNTTYTLTKSGSTITLTGSDGSTTSVTDSNTTYPVATTSTNGLMSSTDKTKLDNISGVSGTSYVIKKDNTGYYIEV